jgi:hypothetical protein
LDARMFATWQRLLVVGQPVSMRIVEADKYIHVPSEPDYGTLALTQWRRLPQTVDIYGRHFKALPGRVFNVDPHNLFVEVPQEDAPWLPELKDRLLRFVYQSGMWTLTVPRASSAGNIHKITGRAVMSACVLVPTELIEDLVGEVKVGQYYSFKRVVSGQGQNLPAETRVEGQIIKIDHPTLPSSSSSRSVRRQVTMTARIEGHAIKLAVNYSSSCSFPEFVGKGMVGSKASEKKSVMYLAPIVTPWEDQLAQVRTLVPVPSVTHRIIAEYL